MWLPLVAQWAVKPLLLLLLLLPPSAGALALLLLLPLLFAVALQAAPLVWVLLIEVDRVQMNLL